MLLFSVFYIKWRIHFIVDVVKYSSFCLSIYKGFTINASLNHSALPIWLILMSISRNTVTPQRLPEWVEIKMPFPGWMLPAHTVTRVCRAWLFACRSPAVFTGVLQLSLEFSAAVLSSPALLSLAPSLLTKGCVLCCFSCCSPCTVQVDFARMSFIATAFQEHPLFEKQLMTFIMQSPALLILFVWGL